MWFVTVIVRLTSAHTTMPVESIARSSQTTKQQEGMSPFQNWVYCSIHGPRTRVTRVTRVTRPRQKLWGEIGATLLKLRSVRLVNAQGDMEQRQKTAARTLKDLPLKNTSFQLFGGNMGYMSVKD